MVITTESGSQYRIVDELCKKYNAEGMIVDVFKVWEMKAVEPWVKTWEDLHESTEEVQVGMSMYISGRDGWWITTPVVSITEVATSDD